MFSGLSRVGELTQRVGNICRDAGKRLEVERLGLPPFDIVDDLGCHLTFAEIDQTSREIIRISVLDEGQSR